MTENKKSSVLTFLPFLVDPVHPLRYPVDPAEFPARRRRDRISGWPGFPGFPGKTVPAIPVNLCSSLFFLKSTGMNG